MHYLSNLATKINTVSQAYLRMETYVRVIYLKRFIKLHDLLGRDLLDLIH